VETTRQVNPNRVNKFSLEKSITEINAASDPFNCHGKNKEKTNRSPSNDWGKSVKITFLKVTTATVSGFSLFDLPIRGPFATKNPGARNDFSFGIRDVNFVPSSKCFKG
jgi:hypothetical protein